MTTIGFSYRPNALVLKINKELGKVVIEQEVLKNQEDKHFQVLDEYSDFEYMFEDKILVIPDPREISEEYKIYFSNAMLPLYTKGEWALFFGIQNKENGVFIVGDIWLPHMVNIKKYLKVEDKDGNILDIEYKF